METVTPIGPASDDAPASDITGPEVVPAGPSLRPQALSRRVERARTLGGQPMPLMGVAMTVLAGIGLVSLIGGAGRLVGRRFPGPVPTGRRPVS